MDFSGFAHALTSPFPARLFIEIGLVVVFLPLRSKDTEGFINGFLSAILLAFVRDLLYGFFPLTDICLLSDVFLFALGLFLYIAPYGSGAALVIAIGLNLLFAVAYTANSILAVVPDLQGPLLRLALVIDALALAAFAFIKRKSADTTTQVVLSKSRIGVSIIFLLYAVAATVFGYEASAFQVFAVPVFYGWFLVVGLGYYKAFDTQVLEACDYYEGSVNSLYNLLLSTGTVLKESFQMGDILDRMNQTIMDEVGATGGLVFLYDEFEDIIEAKSLLGSYPPPIPLPENVQRKRKHMEAYMRHLQLKPGETMFGEVAHTGKLIFIQDARTDPQVVNNNDKDASLELRSVIVVPLMVEDRIIGVYSVVKSGPFEGFTEKDFEKVQTLSSFGALSVNNFFSFVEAKEKTVIDKSANIAAEIQKTIIPKKLPEFTGISFGAYTTPAKGVSGDYYDVIQTRRDKVVLAIGDVAGKGVQAALIMVMVRSILHLVTNTDKDVRTMMSWINRGITGKIDIDSYATIGLLEINVDTGVVEYSNANHPPVLVYRKAMDTIEAVEIKSLPIGVDKLNEYAKKSFRLEPGDVIVMYTDGILESMNGQGKQYGRKSLGNVVMQNHALSAKDIAAKIKTDLDAFVGSSRQHDDQTILVMKMKQ